MKQIIILFSILCFSQTTLLAQDGSPDSSFGVDGKVLLDYNKDAYFYTTAVQQDGKIIAAGEMHSNGSPVQIKSILVRFNPGGSLDASFGNNGTVVVELYKRYTSFNAIAIQSDGKIIVAGYNGNHMYHDSPYVFSKILVMRFNKNGKKDISFGSNGIALIKMQNYDLSTSALRIQQDGKIVVSGSLRSFGLIPSAFGIITARLQPNGSLDSSFNGKGTKIISNGYFTSSASMAVLEDGHILLCGLTLPDQNSAAQYFLAKLLPNGLIENSFGKNGKVVTNLTISNPFMVNAMAVLQNGKILVGGSADFNEIYDDLSLIQFNNDGSIDSSFGNDGMSHTDFGYDDMINALTIQSDGKIIAAGISDDFLVTNKANFVLARYNLNGNLDSSFGNQGKVITSFTDRRRASANAIALQPDGKIVAAGYAGTPSGFNEVPVVNRYLNDNPPLASFSKLISTDQIQLYPNPVKNVLQIKGMDASSVSILRITSQNGHVYKTKNLKETSFSWNVADLPKGIYYLTIENKNIVSEKMFIKN